MGQVPLQIYYQDITFDVNFNNGNFIKNKIKDITEKINLES